MYLELIWTKVSLPTFLVSKTSSFSRRRIILQQLDLGRPRLDLSSEAKRPPPVLGHQGDRLLVVPPQVRVLLKDHAEIDIWGLDTGLHGHSEGDALSSPQEVSGYQRGRRHRTQQWNNGNPRVPWVRRGELGDDGAIAHLHQSAVDEFDGADRVSVFVIEPLKAHPIISGGGIVQETVKKRDDVPPGPISSRTARAHFGQLPS